jgi:hypothetical protein
MKMIFVGNFSVGNRSVDLFADPNSRDGHFNLNSDKPKPARIEVGIDKGWDRVTHVLLHEVFELVMTDAGHRYAPVPDYGMDNGGYYFHFDHTQFSHLTAKAGEFLSLALPALAKIYDKVDKKRKK